MVDRTASVTGAVVGLAALVLAVIALVRTPAAGDSGGTRVRTGRDGIAAGADVRDNAIGDGGERW